MKITYLIPQAKVISFLIYVGILNFSV